jgi:hypothetical protein
MNGRAKNSHEQRSLFSDSETQYQARPEASLNVAGSDSPLQLEVSERQAPATCRGS